MSATVEFFEQDFIVGQYECDCNGRMKAGALMAQSQAISTNHCNELGLTIDVYRRTHTVFSARRRRRWRFITTSRWR